MKKIYSKMEKDVLLHCVVRLEDLKEGRLDVSPESEFLQLSGLVLKAGKTFKAHKHIPCNKEMTLPCESWVCVKGSVKIFHYDLDDTIINEDILYPGDVTITYRGGHNYLVMEDGAFWEFKNGNYSGQADDKVFI